MRVKTRCALGRAALCENPDHAKHCQVEALVATAGQLLSATQEGMQAYWDDRSEAWQESESGEAFEQVLERLKEPASASPLSTANSPAQKGSCRGRRYRFAPARPFRHYNLDYSG